ncbi:hypothetical protein [Aquibacillus kalidii]|uniref:hypothetical protein n=1 Tax=Aquibacillus kalidii TaxID=2762597 RepID=UPI001C99C293|nr:hypothetical protein [Aquibacillus kalidii]
MAIALLVPSQDTFAKKVSTDGDEQEVRVEHNWKRMSSEFKLVHTDTHDYTVWHNFIKKTRKCDISHRMKTEVWYCDLHNHAKSEVSFEETIHSHQHK